LDGRCHDNQATRDLHTQLRTNNKERTERPSGTSASGHRSDSDARSQRSQTSKTRDACWSPCGGAFRNARMWLTAAGWLVAGWPAGRPFGFWTSAESEAGKTGQHGGLRWSDRPTDHPPPLFPSASPQPNRRRPRKFGPQDEREVGKSKVLDLPRDCEQPRPIEAHGFQ
jgi:hypothetical protein